MGREIEVRELTTLSITPDGREFRLGVKDSAGEDVGVILQTTSICSLMMSLFRVGDTAFKRLMCDENARLVYPASECHLRFVPGSDKLILVLKTPDGFEASFEVRPEHLQDLAVQSQKYRAEPVTPQVSELVN